MASRHARKIDHRHRLAGFGQGNLHRQRIDRAEAGAQRLVPGDQTVERTVQGTRRQGTFNAHGRGEVVGAVGRLQPVQEPQPLLGEGEGVVLVRIAGSRHQGRQTVYHRALLRSVQHVRHQPFNRPRPTGERRVLEQAPHRHRSRHQVAQPRNHLGGQQRVATQVEETVLPPDSFNSQHLSPDFRKLAFEFAARLLVGRLSLSAGGIWVGQRSTVDLLVDGDRELLQSHKDSGHHVARQALGQVVAQLSLGNFVLQRQIGNQPLVSRLPPLTSESSRQDDALTHRRMARQKALDLAQLDTETTDLDLVVDAPKKVDPAVGQHPHQVTGAIQPVPVALERVRNQPAGGERRPPEVALHEAIATKDQLATAPQRLKIDPVGPQYIDLGVGKRPSDGHRGGIAGDRFDRRVGGDDGTFCRPIGVQ